MKYLKYYNEARDMSKPWEARYTKVVKDTTHTDKRITHLAARLTNFFESIGLNCDYNPIWRPITIVGTNKQVRDIEHHDFTIQLDMEEIKRYSVGYYLLHDYLSGGDIRSVFEFSVNISCPTLTKVIPQINLSDNMWEQSLHIIKKGIAPLAGVIDDNLSYDVVNQKDKKPAIISDGILKQIMINIANTKNSNETAAMLKKKNKPLYDKIMVLYDTLKDKHEDPLSNIDIDKGAEMHDRGFND